jgi:hypothetical protein
MSIRVRDLADRVQSIRRRATALGEVRALVGLSSARDLRPEQWDAIGPRLAAAGSAIRDRANALAHAWLHDGAPARTLAALHRALGELEIDLARAYQTLDTFVDIATQRHSPVLGPYLAGCDVLAEDALARPMHSLATLVPPITYCDRGAGASVLREGAPMNDGGTSPLALIEIPYSRFSDKLTLVSLLHEVGHQGIARLGLTEPLAELLARAAAVAAAAERDGRSDLEDAFARWSGEIGPDFWAFGCSGLAQPAALRDVVSFPQLESLRVADGAVHPPPYLRVLLAFAFARATWGAGPWDAWERSWLLLHPLGDLPLRQRAFLLRARRALPKVARALLTAGLRPIGNRPLASLFDFRATDPRRLHDIARGATRGRLELGGLRPCAHLGVFRLIHEQRWLRPDRLERVMTRWLCTLGARRRVARPRRTGERSPCRRAS